jgi:Ni/Fe-hydrogenase subunit HybB-like protein
MEALDEARPLQSLRLPALGWKGNLLFVVLPLILIGGGLYAYTQQRLHGDVVTNMRSVGSGGAAWGLYIMFDIFFVGLAATGIAVTSAAHLFRLEALRSISRIAEFMAVLSLGLAGICVMADQGRPIEALLNLPNYARVMSPFFGSFTLIVGVGLAASAVMLYLGGRGDAAWCARRPGRLRWAYKIWASGYKGTDGELGRHRLARFWLSLTMFPFIIAAYSTLGFVFGTQGGRPGWFGALRAPSMLVVAGISGMGLLMAIAGLLKLKLCARDAIPDHIFIGLGKTLSVFLSVFVYLLAVETLTERYAGREAEMGVSDAILFGSYAPVFWSMLGVFLVALVVLLVQFLRRKPMVPYMIVVGILVNVGAVLRRFLVVVPAQTHGHYLDYQDGFYMPNSTEYAVIAGICSIGVLAFVVFMRNFPIIPLHAYYGRMRSSLDPEPRRNGLLRWTLTSATLVGGCALAAFGLAMAARFGTEAYLDPLVPYSPVLFIIGIVMTIYSAAVYVIVPPG